MGKAKNFKLELAIQKETVQMDSSAFCTDVFQLHLNTHQGYSLALVLAKSLLITF